MRTVFGDTFYWVATLNPRDDWHERVIEASAALQPIRIVTTDEVLDEVLTFFAAYGPDMRTRAAQFVRSTLAHPDIDVVPQTRTSFLAGLDLYANRPDKEWSLTDCISMETMRERGLMEALTHDHHFEQAGFIILFK